MAPPTAGPSSRSSSVSSAEPPFATPPSSPAVVSQTRIPKPAPTSSTAAHLAKVRSMSASANSNRPPAGSIRPFIAARDGLHMQASSSSLSSSPPLSAGRPHYRKSLSAGRAEGKSIAAALLEEGRKDADRMEHIKSTPSASPSSTGTRMIRTTSADGAARLKATVSGPSGIPVPRRQRSASQLSQKKQYSSPHGPVPPLPAAHSLVPTANPTTPTASTGPQVSIIQPTPTRIPVERTLPPPPPSELVPGASSTHTRPRGSSPSIVGRTPSHILSVGDPRTVAASPPSLSSEDERGRSAAERGSRMNGLDDSRSSRSASQSPSGLNWTPAASSRKASSRSLRSARSSPSNSPQDDFSPTVLPSSLPTPVRSKLPRKVGASAPKSLFELSAPPPVSPSPSSVPDVDGEGASTIATSPESNASTATAHTMTPSNSPRAAKGSSRNKSTSPRPDRKSPGLTISPPPPPFTHHIVTSSTSSKEAPPLPAKSPLRRLGRRPVSTIGIVPPVPSMANAPPVPPIPAAMAVAPQGPTSLAAPQETSLRPLSPSEQHAQSFAPPLDSQSIEPILAPVPLGMPLAEASAASNAASRSASTNATPVIPEEPEFAERLEVIRDPPGRTMSNITSSTTSTVSTDSAQAISSVGSTSSLNPAIWSPSPLTSQSAPLMGASPNDLESPLSIVTAIPAYTQDSAPPSAPPSSINTWIVGAATADSKPDSASASSVTTPTSAVSEVCGMRFEKQMSLPSTPERAEKRESLRMSAMWGGQRDSPTASPSAATAGHQEDGSLTPLELQGKALPAVPNNLMVVKNLRTPTSPARMLADHGGLRSPSMPTLSKGRPRGSTESSQQSPKFPRSQTGPLRQGVSHNARPQSMILPAFPTAPSTPTLSKRAHLLREIAMTERTHATDLALIRDAYIGRDFRPDSQHSSGYADSSLGTPESRVEWRHARRSSSYGVALDEKRGSGYETNRASRHQGEPRRTSGHERRPSGHERRISGHGDSAWANAWNGLMSPVLKSPRETNVNGSLESLYNHSAHASTTSVHHLAHTPPVIASPRYGTPNSFSGPPRASAVAGRPLPPNDLKTVFLNISQLALMSEELAVEFERALGNAEDESVSPVGEGGTDRMGEVFVQMLPKLKPLYMYYCSRQSHASTRLVELMGDSAYSAHLNDCWSKVKGLTHAWNLDSMLIKPVQRITKYPLLFDDLLSCTAPGHPDYYAIRNAAASARSLALEIDEAKRRKDVITSVISKSTSTVNLPKDVKGSGPGGRLLALRRFKKDKPGPGNLGSGEGPPPDITPFARAQLTELVARLEEGEKMVRRLGMEMLEWAQTSKVIVNTEMAINLGFLRWYTLDGTGNDPRSVKVRAFKALLEEVVRTAWEEMNSEVCNSIMLMFGKLLDAAKNPLMIIQRLNSKSAEYGRYVAHRQAKKSIERGLQLEAIDYVAIHTQLLEELPAFMEGYTRIFDIAVAAFVMAQQRYYATIRDKVLAYTLQYLSEPTEMITDNGRIKEVRLNVSVPRGIHKAWHDRWREPNNEVRNLAIAGGDGSRASVTRIKAFGTRRTGGSVGQPTSPVSRPVNHPVNHPPLRHTPSLVSNRSAPREEGTRRRSVSLSAPPSGLPENGNTRRPSLLRRSSQKKSAQENSRPSSLSRQSSLGPNSRNGTPDPGGISHGRTLSRKGSQVSALSQRSQASQTRGSLRSLSSMERESRLSFGLPRIPMDESHLLFDGFGLSLGKSPTPIFTTLGDGSSPSLNEGSFSAFNLGTDGSLRSSVATDDMDPSDTWREQRVLYSCAAVADFNPLELGNHKFQGLAFLPLMAGDLVDVFHEVGRVADLPDFPYSQVGVENDGAVVCRDENGMIGVAMCSFLEPLRT